MDPLSIAASTIGITQLISSLGEALTKYAIHFRRNDDINALHIKLVDIGVLMKQLKVLADMEGWDLDQLHSFAEQVLPGLSSLDQALKQLAATIPEFESEETRYRIFGPISPVSTKKIKRLYCHLEEALEGLRTAVILAMRQTLNESWLSTASEAAWIKNEIILSTRRIRLVTNSEIESSQQLPESAFGKSFELTVTTIYKN
jgi:hypothetical protein